MADEMGVLRSRIDDVFGWEGKVIDHKHKKRRAAAQATLLLLESSPDDAKSDILHTKIFTLLQGEVYCSHEGALFEYCSGAMVPSTHSTISSASLELIIAALRHARAYYLAMARPKEKPSRTFEDVSWHLRAIHSLNDDRTLFD